jgi:hypothetical protein
MQMGAIYAGAQITVVAAAGSDPNFGLPGVLSQGRSVPKAEKVGKVWLKPLPRLVQLAEVSESKWASRAWTFQEFHRSRRRLIFTENQAIFVCNSGMKYEIAFSGISWISSSKEREQDIYWAQQWLPRCTMTRDLQYGGATTMDRAAGYLEAYSKRDLSYDTDALDAIAGALEPLQKDNVYHIWGVPFQYTSKGPTECFPAVSTNLSGNLNHDEESFPSANSTGQANTLSQDRVDCGPSYVLTETEQILREVGMYRSNPCIGMALSWYHIGTCLRRQGFPSWSPLGWAGPIGWHRIHGIANLSVVLTHTFQAKVHNPTSNYELSASTLVQEHAFDSGPPALELMLKTVRLDLHYKFSHYNFQVAVRLNFDYVYLVDVIWDISAGLVRAQRLMGALLKRIRFEVLIMVFATHGELWERVGIIKLDLSSNFSLGVRHHRNLDTRISTSECLTVLESLRVTDTGEWWHNIFEDYRPILIQ